MGDVVPAETSPLVGTSVGLGTPVAMGGPCNRLPITAVVTVGPGTVVTALGLSGLLPPVVPSLASPSTGVRLLPHVGI